MACHEIAALRIGLMNVMGFKDDAVLAHEMAELGDGIEEPGPLRSLSQARSMTELCSFFDASVADLEQRVATTPKADPATPYYRTLLVLTKKTEADLRNQQAQVLRLFQDLEDMHDFVHELYPGD